MSFDQPSLVFAQVDMSILCYLVFVSTAVALSNEARVALATRSRALQRAATVACTATNFRFDFAVGVCTCPIGTPVFYYAGSAGTGGSCVATTSLPTSCPAYVDPETGLTDMLSGVITFVYPTIGCSDSNGSYYYPAAITATKETADAVKAAQPPKPVSL